MSITSRSGVVAAENSSAFVHPLHENTVGMIGPLQGENFLSTVAVHNNGIPMQRFQLEVGPLHQSTRGRLCEQKSTLRLWDRAP